MGKCLNSVAAFQRDGVRISPSFESIIDLAFDQRGEADRRGRSFEFQENFRFPALDEENMILSSTMDRFDGIDPTSRSAGGEIGNWFPLECPRMLKHLEFSSLEAQPGLQGSVGDRG